MCRRLALVLSAGLLLTGIASAQTNVQERLRRELRRAETLEKGGQLPRALRVIEAVLQESPAESRAILILERIYRRQGRLEMILPVVGQAIEAEPRNALPRQVELRALADLARFGELREAGERWLRAAPNSEVAYREYASVLHRTGASRDAELVLRSGRSAIGRPDALASELADLYLSERRWTEAAAEWVTLLQNSPAIGWNVVNFKLESLGASAAPAAGALLELLSSPGATETEPRLAAIAALYANRPEEAQARAGSVFKTAAASERDEFAKQFAKVAARQSRSTLVAWVYRQRLRDVTDDSTRWGLARQIVQHDLSAGDTASALGTLDEVLARSQAGSPSHQWSSAWKVRLYSAQTEPRAAERAFVGHMRLYSDDPELPELALSVAEANLRRGRLSEASRVLDAFPGDESDLRVAARLAVARGYLALYEADLEKAEGEFEFAAAELTGETRSEALRFLGFLRNGNPRELEAVAVGHRAGLQGRWLQGYERLVEGLERTPASSARPAMLLWAGELAVRGAALERAEEVLRRIPALYPRSGEAPVALMTLAEALAERNRRPVAMELLESLILDYPESALAPIARRRLAELSGQVPRS
ncbi:MAG: tetratricopeptide repeat protein [Gemmatimonadota bacterium]